jgi:maltooligosyltrehalose trehalohydrolase
MRAAGDGFHQLNVSTAGPASLYKFELADGLIIPDPLSRFQPQDVRGPSEVIDPSAYEWQVDWRGRPWEEAVIYELHIGTFTSAGTFRSAIDKLDHLVELGVTAIELMPVADFPGQWNWGYDGVQPFAPESSYGRPEDLKALVDAAHARGLMMLLDVVYNHFGPDGNYLPSCCPIFTERHHTPWGPAVNFDSEGSEVVREIVCENALYWIEEYQFDGLRLDAVHAIKDDSPKHILDEIAERVRAATRGRQVHLVLENARPLHYTAQWNDDLHHLLHTASTGELKEFYPEFADDTGKLGRALAEGFAFQGEWTTQSPRLRGEPSAFLPSTAFISFVQNHDQIGNRPLGERYSHVAPNDAARVVIAILLLSPQIPLIFMGEEWGASTPFFFFSNFTGELAEAVRNGRREEFGRYPEFRDPDKRDRIPDPIARETFEASKLRWNEANEPGHREWLAFYRDLLELRRKEIAPRLRGMVGYSGQYEILGHQAVRVTWRLGDGSALTLVVNLKAAPQGFSNGGDHGRVLWRRGQSDRDGLGPWAAMFSLTNAD